MRRLVVRKVARAEILAAFTWYLVRSPASAADFVTAIDSAIGEIDRSPERYPVVHGMIRRRLLSRFPYAVYYKVFPTVTSVIGVIHGRRHPEAWLRR